MRRIQMVCISPELLSEDIDTMLEVSGKLPVVTCIKSIFDEKVEFTDFVCLLNCDELSAYSEEQLQRNFKKSNVVIIHNDEKVLKKARSFGYLCVEISDRIYISDNEKIADYQFESLEDMLNYQRKVLHVLDIKAGIFMMMALVALILSISIQMWAVLLNVLLLTALICFCFAVYYYRMKLIDIVVFILDGLF